MSVKIWQVPNKSKAMAQVFARKSGAHARQRSRIKEREEWMKEAYAEMYFSGDVKGGMRVECQNCHTELFVAYDDSKKPVCPSCQDTVLYPKGANW